MHSEERLVALLFCDAVALHHWRFLSHLFHLKQLVLRSHITVGRIMSDDLFSFTNCGEPKQVVVEFIDEVVTTLGWVTEEVRERSQPPPTPHMSKEVVEESVVHMGRMQCG